MTRPATPGGLCTLYPDPGHVALEGLYLGEELRRLAPVDEVLFYANFIASLDGRIAVAREAGAPPSIPDETINPRDWRLLLELAAPADALLVSGRYLRELAEGDAQAPPPFEGDPPRDIVAFRERLGLPAQPALVVVSAGLEFTPEVLLARSGRRVVVATTHTADADAVRRFGEAGIEVVRAGVGQVEGRALETALAELGFGLVYSIAGPAILHMLLAARVLRRLYLTTVLRVLGGRDYATLVEGARLEPPYDLDLTALYLDRRGPDGVAQLLQVYDSPA